MNENKCQEMCICHVVQGKTYIRYVYNKYKKSEKYCQQTVDNHR